MNSIDGFLSSRRPAAFRYGAEPEAPRPAPTLRLALFTGNYNYIKDGVALTLNRLVDFLQRRDIPVLIVAPTGPAAALDAVGELLSVPSFPIPSRPEYRMSLGLTSQVRRRLEQFRPTLFHIAVPDILGYQALRLGERWNVPVVASYHTRYDTYLKYYGLGALEPLGRTYLRHFYGRCSQIYPPSESMMEILRKEGITRSMQVWSRGVDTQLFNPRKRSLVWRRQLGVADDEVIVTYAGRLVKEKNTGLLVRIIDGLRRSGARFRSMIVGNGPEEAAMRAALPDSIFAGFLHGENLARAYASSDVFVFPSESETFGNVTLEAMASGLPAVCADASGSSSLVVDGRTGFLASAGNERHFIDTIGKLIASRELRARMGATALERALDYKWDTVLAGLLANYMGVMEDAGSSAAASKRRYSLAIRPIGNPTAPSRIRT